MQMIAPARDWKAQKTANYIMRTFYNKAGDEKFPVDDSVVQWHETVVVPDASKLGNGIKGGAAYHFVLFEMPVTFEEARSLADNKAAVFPVRISAMGNDEEFGEQVLRTYHTKLLAWLVTHDHPKVKFVTHNPSLSTFPVQYSREEIVDVPPQPGKTPSETVRERIMADMLAAKRHRAE